MAPEGITKSFDLGDGRTVSIETGRLAKQADGAVVVKLGNTMLLATVVAKKEAEEGVDFLPLTVNYREMYASAGKFPGGFFKREARPSEHEILVSRLVDRALRPMFPEDFHAGLQVQIQLISADKETPPDALAGLAASSAIAVSDLPFNGPISEVRVGRVNGEFKINPSFSELENADIDIIIAGTENSVLMVEGEMLEVSEKDMSDAIAFGHEAIKTQCAIQDELTKATGKTEKREYHHEDNDEDFAKRVMEATYQKFYDIAKAALPKHERSEKTAAVQDEFTETLSEEELEKYQFMLPRYLKQSQKEATRDLVLKEKVRLDGRKLDEIRPIWTEIDYLPGAHGSAIFTRGETQSLTTVTLGTKLDEQTIDGAIISGSNDFLLHYNFPSFSTGEARPSRGTSRREVGHGNLAWRALKPMLPGNEENPYTVRVVSDILESNGSSSMATVCAGSMALMDAGVKLKKPVSGIAMGLITNEDNSNYGVLSDILGDEDHLGDMDFKVTGTKDGITAVQMDMKVKGLPQEVLMEALEQAKRGREHIMNEMLKTIDKPREDYKPHVPRIVQTTIPKEFIGAIIGPGGKIIQEMQAETGATIMIDEVGDRGVIDISADNKKAIDAVLEKIKAIVAVPEVGEEYEGVVKGIQPYGAFIEFLPGKQGLLHISEISWSRIENVSDVFKEGDTVKVKLIEVDERTGKYRLSRKVLIPKPDFAGDGKDS